MDFIQKSLYVSSSCLSVQDHLRRIREVDKKIGYTNGWKSYNYGLSIETTTGYRKLGLLVKVKDHLLTVDSWTLLHFIHSNLENGTLKLIGIYSKEAKWPNHGESSSVNPQQSILFEYQGVRFIVAVPFLRDVEIPKTFISDAFYFLNRLNLDSNKIKLPTSLFMEKSRSWLNTSRFKALEQKSSQDQNNFFPVSGYLLLIWKAYAKILNRPFHQAPIILENLTIFRDLSLPRNGTAVHFQVNVVKKTGKFIILSENLLLVRGIVHSVSTKNGKKHPPLAQLKKNPVNPEIEIEFKLKWKGNWMDLFDSLLQILISNYGQSQILPTCGHLDKVILDPETFVNSIQDQSNLLFSSSFYQENSSCKIVPVYYQKTFFHSFMVKCEGIQFQGWKYKDDFREKNDYSLVIENIPYKDCPSYESSIQDQSIEKGTLDGIMKEKRDTRDLRIISNIFRMEEKTHLRKSLQNLIIVDKEADIFNSSSSSNSQFDIPLKRQTETDLFNTLSNDNKSSNSDSNSSKIEIIPNCLSSSLDSLDKEIKDEPIIISPVSNERETEKDDKVTIVIESESENTEESKITESLSTSSSRMSSTLSGIQPGFTYIMYLFVLCTVGVLCTVSLFLRTGIRIGFKLFKQTDKIKLMNQMPADSDEQSNISIIMKCSGVPVPSKMYKILQQGLVGNIDNNDDDKLSNGNDGNTLSWRIEKGLFFNYWEKDQNFDVKNHIFFESPHSQENINLDNEALKISEFYNNHKWFSESNPGQTSVMKKPQWECRILYPQNSTSFLISFVAHTSYGNTLFFTKMIQKAMSQFYNATPEIYAIYPVLKMLGSTAQREQKQMEDKSRDKGQVESCGQRLLTCVTSTLTQVHNTILDLSQNHKKGTKSKEIRKDADGKVVEFIIKESQIIKSSNIVNCLSKAFRKISDARRNRNNFAGGKKQLNKNENVEQDLPLKFLNVEKQLNFPHNLQSFDNSWIFTKIIPSLANPFRYFVNFLLPSSFPGITKTMIIFSRDHETVGSMINNEEGSVTLCVLDENQLDMNQHITEYFLHNFQKELDKIIDQSQNFDIDRKRSNSDVVIPILD